MAGSSGMVWARVSYESGNLSRRTMARWAIDHLRYRLRGADDAATAQVMAEVKEMLTGVKISDLESMGPQVLAGVLPRIYPRMLDEVHSHRDGGRPTFIISAAGDDLVSELARTLGMDGGIGTKYEVLPDGTLTGELEGPFMYGEGKVVAMRDFAERHEIELSESFAYSDSASDLPMLRAVGHPVAVNPDAVLATVAREENWRVLRFEQIGRKLTLAGAGLAAAALGTGAALIRRSRPRRPQRRGSVQARRAAPARRPSLRR
jgi:HAD superfamily hydrolase (TIGR01490 family)